MQRKLRIGYNRSARLLEDMEKAGLVSALTTSGQREVLVPARSEQPSPARSFDETYFATLFIAATAQLASADGLKKP